MPYTELQSDDLTPESARMFWRFISELGFTKVAVEVVAETATLEATSLRWRATGLGPIGVCLCIFNLMQSWEKLASSSISDAEYDKEVIGEEMDGSLADLQRIQRILQSKQIPATNTQERQSLGIVFGKVFVNETPGYDWWIVEDVS